MQALLGKKKQILNVILQNKNIEPATAPVNLLTINYTEEKGLERTVNMRSVSNKRAVSELTPKLSVK